MRVSLGGQGALIQPEGEKKNRFFYSGWADTLDLVLNGLLRSGVKAETRTCILIDTTRGALAKNLPEQVQDTHIKVFFLGHQDTTK